MNKSVEAIKEVKTYNTKDYLTIFLWNMHVEKSQRPCFLNDVVWILQSRTKQKFSKCNTAGTSKKGAIR